MSIVTLADMKSYLRGEQFPDEAIISACLSTAHSTFYNMCGRSFELDTPAASPRSYTPTWTDVLRIHDCTSVTSITTGGNAVTSTYQLEPVGAINWAGEVRPYEQIRLLGNWWFPSTFITQANVVVTAKWGWAATPAPAVEAVKMLCKDIVGNRDVRAGFVSFGDAGIAAARRNPFVVSVVEQYGRAEATVGIA